MKKSYKKTLLYLFILTFLSSVFMWKTSFAWDTSSPDDLDYGMQNSSNQEWDTATDADSDVPIFTPDTDPALSKDGGQQGSINSFSSPRINHEDQDTDFARPVADVDLQADDQEATSRYTPLQRIKNAKAVFYGLDKISGHVHIFTVAIDDTYQFGSLQVTPRICYTSAENEPDKTNGYVEVKATTLDRQIKSIFSGWMFANSPGLNAVDHPVYDVWLKGCMDPIASSANTSQPHADVEKLSDGGTLEKDKTYKVLPAVPSTLH